MLGRSISLPFILAAYAIGGTANHNLFLAIHEIAHNLAFRGVKANKLFAMFANLPIGIPYAITFKRYHIEHHKHLGEYGIDTDLPSRLEMIYLQNVAGKAFFWSVLPSSLLPLHPNAPFYPFARSKSSSMPSDQASSAPNVQPSGTPSTSSPSSNSMPPSTTFSAGAPWYTSSCRASLLVGYHNEHHDFPLIPWIRLPALRALAPEFYDTLPGHPSWPMLTYRFIFDEDVGLYSCVKRQPKEAGLKKVDTKVTKEAEAEGERWYASDDECVKEKKH
ncbi:hypothetical protein FS749_001943 [Ceratobasidium sp. UAMH 11750]|nr:hypothetical protein FS749_001943 [Ceratobasidium sp. UAMH 11750]